MNNSLTIGPLTGKVQHYAWGGIDFIPALLGQPAAGKPSAEYWMGAHDNVPSSITLPGGETRNLNEWIAASPVALLGKAVYEQFGRLPYLFKVLDVKDMLSIQVHPTRAAAIAEFAAENIKGTPLNAPDRNYKDDNHKPELMLALGNFWLLHGFKPAAALKAILEQTKELQFLAPVFGNNNYAALYQAVMNMPQETVNQHLQPLANRIVPLYDKGALNRSQEDFWAARAVHTFCEPGRIDRGIFSIYFFNLLHLKEGEAIFQDAGIPHAYLEGQNIEIMANSDNVLRGGLTNKHVDVAELMKHVRFEPVHPQVSTGVAGAVPEEKIFPTPVNDFELHELNIPAGKAVMLNGVTTEIFLVYSGAVEVSGGGTSFNRAKGQCWWLAAGAACTVLAGEKAVIFRATVPASLV